MSVTVPDVRYVRFHGRLAQFRRLRSHLDFWEERWSEHELREVLDAHRNGKLDEFETMFLRYLPRDLPVLEAGCGMGYLVMALHARGYDAHGIDNASQTVAAIQSVAPELKIRVGDVYAIDAGPGTYGGYISIGVFEHTPDGPEAGLREVARVLHPRGYAFISVPYLNAPRRRLRDSLQETASPTPDGLSFYQYYFDADEFSAYVKEAGLEVVEAVPYALYSGLTRDHALGRWLHAHKFFSWQIQKRVTRYCRTAPLLPRRRWAHMIMFICRKAAQA